MAETDSRILEYLEEGLFLYGVGKVQESINRWRKVLELDPKNERAMDYIESAGGDVSAYRSRVAAPPVTPTQTPTAPTPRATQPAPAPPRPAPAPAAAAAPPGWSGAPPPGPPPGMPRTPPPPSAPAGWPAAPVTTTPEAFDPFAAPTNPQMPAPAGFQTAVPAPARPAAPPPRPAPQPPRALAQPLPQPMPPAPRPAGPPPSAPRAGETRDELLSKAAALYRAKYHEAALELLERIAKEFPPVDDTLRGYLDASRAAVLDTLRAQWSRTDLIPKPRLGSQQIMQLKLSPEAGFILSRIDGSSSVEDILSVCGLDQFTALRALNILLQQGAIELSQ